MDKGLITPILFQIPDGQFVRLTVTGLSVVRWAIVPRTSCSVGLCRTGIVGDQWEMSCLVRIEEKLKNMSDTMAVQQGPLHWCLEVTVKSHNAWMIVGSDFSD